MLNVDDDIDYKMIPYDVKKESIKTRRTPRKVTRTEIRRDAFITFCKSLLPVTLALGITVGFFGGTSINDFIQDYEDNRYLVQQVRNFRSCYIGPNEQHITWVDEDTHERHHGYYYDYDYIGKIVLSSPNQDEAIYYCYCNIGTEYTGKLISKISSFDNFDDYIKSLGFDDVKKYAEYMRHKLLLTHNIDKQQQELEQLDSNYDLDNNKPKIGGM